MPSGSIPFVKFAAAGNDFVILRRDRAPADPGLGKWVRRVCVRAMGVGADGVVLIDDASAAGPVRLRFYNPDGLEHEFCGNGLRCAARLLAMESGLDPVELKLQTSFGPVRARIEGSLVRTSLPEVTGEPRPVAPLAPGLAARAWTQHAGVPHLVVLVKDPSKVDLDRYGPMLRHDPRFAPRGVNVDFVSDGAARPVILRTWERGVEAETLACGSGAVAAALVLGTVLGGSSPIEFLTASGECLEVDFERLEDKRHRVVLAGKARAVYSGELCRESSDFDPDGIRGRSDP